VVIYELEYLFHCLYHDDLDNDYHRMLDDGLIFIRINRDCIDGLVFIVVVVAFWR
jgi:hypothetical protein